jgi:hypothetical protein
MALALTLIQGEAVEDFVREQGDAYDSDLRELRALWSNFLQSFEHRFLDTQRDAKARESIEKLTLEDVNIDLYIQKFKSLARKAQYDLQEHSVIRIFLQGLPFHITKEVIGAPKPRSFGEHAVKAIEAVNADNSLKSCIEAKIAVDPLEIQPPRDAQTSSNHPDGTVALKGKDPTATAPRIKGDTTCQTPLARITTSQSPWT